MNDGGEVTSYMNGQKFPSVQVEHESWFGDPLYSPETQGTGSIEPETQMFPAVQSCFWTPVTAISSVPSGQ
jgi:hypothetical protein